MHVYKQLVPPSVVTHTLTGPFTSSNANDLLVVRGNSLLQLFQTKDVSTKGEDTDGESTLVSGSNGAVRSSNTELMDDSVITGSDSFIGTEISTIQTVDKMQNKTKLILIAEWHLDGFITDINKVRTVASNDTDCVVISFRYAKLVILQWDSETLSFAPISVHFYEKNLPFGSAPGLRSGADKTENDPSQKGIGNRAFTSQTARAANTILDSATSVIPEHQTYHFADPNFPSTFIIDPFSSCLCLLYQKDQMAFLPFTKEDDLDDFKNGINSKFLTSTTTSSDLPPIYFPSFLVHASKLDEKISNIIGMAFLHEYREPTMAIIFEPVETWAPTAPLNKDTVQYLVLSLDLQNRSSTAIISIDSLPYDMDQIFPLPAPVGGSLLIGANHLVHVDSSGKVSGLAVNQYSKLVTKMNLGFFDQSAELGNLTLEGSTAVVLETSTDVLIILKNGEKYSLKFSIESRKVQGMKLVKAVVSTSEVGLSGITPTSATSLGPSHVFIGSSTGDSTLLSWNHTEDCGSEIKSTVITSTVVQPTKTTARVDDDMDYDDLYADEDDEKDDEEDKKDEIEDNKSVEPVDPPVDDSKSLEPAESADGDVDIYDDEYDDIYGAGASTSVQKKKAALASSSSRINTLAPIKLSLDDIIHSYGPINDIAIGRPVNSDKYIRYSEPSDYLYDIVASTGAGPTGGLSIFQKTVRPNIISDLNLNEDRSPLTGVWTLAPRSKVVSEGVTVFDSFVLATSDGSSKLYRIGEEFADITDNTELLLKHTIKAGTLLAGSVIFQVHEEGVIFYDSDLARIGNYNSESGIVSASFADPYISLLTSNGSPVILTIGEGDVSSESNPLTIKQIDIHSGLTASKIRASFICSSPLAEIKFQTTSGSINKKRKRDSETMTNEGTESAPQNLLILVDHNSSIIVSIYFISSFSNHLTNRSDFKSW